MQIFSFNKTCGKCYLECHECFEDLYYYEDNCYVDCPPPTENCDSDCPGAEWDDRKMCTDSFTIYSETNFQNGVLPLTEDL